MKFSKLLFVCLAFSLCFHSVMAQTQLSTNASINILTANAGVVNQGSTLDLLVTVTNTGANPIQPNRTRPSINIPIAIASAASNSFQTGLPTGWIITNNTGGNITICNGTDVIPSGETRSIIIKLVGTAIGGPSTIGSQLQFGPGTTVCTGFGSLTGDNPADNNSQTTVTVVAGPVPLTLLSFNASLNNCLPILKWVTESEINTDRFEIERNELSNNNGTWKTVGEVIAKNTQSTNNYLFADNTTYTNSSRIFYRLKMIDRDGSFKYSDVLPLQIDCKQITVQAYPNPVQDGKLYVNVNGALGKTEGILLSVSGQIVSRKPITNGTNFMNVSGIANGTYILNILGANGLDQKVKVVINK